MTIVSRFRVKRKDAGGTESKYLSTGFWLLGPRASVEVLIPYNIRNGERFYEATVM